MPTAKSVRIRNIDCSNMDYPNLLRNVGALKNPELSAVIQALLNHPASSLVSIPMLYSFHYRTVLMDTKMDDIATRRMAMGLAARKVLNIADTFLPIP